MAKKRVVIIGGGTGTYTLLRGLKQYHQQIDITAVVNMSDSGGSTGRLRDEFGFLPVGDVRMALVALASEIDEQEELLRKLFLYRFDKGEGLSGHNFGNLLLVALTDILGSEEAAIRAAARVLRVCGQVVPITTEKVDLVATYDDGVVVNGEHDIDEPTKDRCRRHITKLATAPLATVNSAAKEAIARADIIVLGPGDFYTSILANCVIEGVSEAIRNSPAKIAFVSNLMTKCGQTYGFGISDLIRELQRYIGRTADHVLVNTAPLPKKLLARYEEDGEAPIAFDGGDQKDKIITADFLASEEVKKVKGDVLRRSLIRHDSNKLARAVVGLL